MRSTSTRTSKRPGSTMAERPLVAVPARFSASVSALRYRADVAATALLEAVYAAGGEPLVFHPVRAADVRARLAWADAVLLPGGGDLAAHWSGQSPHPAQYDVDEVQDAVDLAVARVALHDGLPMLAVCRGLQVVNVALGGDLRRDLDHRHLVHEIRSSHFAERLTVSCYHHQGLGRLGTGLRAVAWAADGTIEAATVDGA